MSEYGLSKHGFKTKNFSQIKTDLEDNLKQEVDPTLRFTPDTVAGVLTGIMANQTHQVWESLQALYSSLDPKSATHDGLKANLKALDGVESVHIEEGLCEFTAYVMGGDDFQIAKALWQYKPLGIQTTGQISQSITASNGQTHFMKFSRAQELLLSLNIKLKVKSLLATEELADLKSQILTYSRDNFKLGTEVYPSRLYPIIFGFLKVLDVVSIKLDPTPKEVKPYELVIFKADKILLEQVLEIAL